MKAESRCSRYKGDIAENFVKNTLLQNGYRLITEKYSKQFGEIDLILLDEETLVFIEVKSGESSYSYHKINDKKKQKLIKVAMDFIENHDIEVSDYRFDAVFVNLYGESVEFEHIKNIITLA